MSRRVTRSAAVRAATSFQAGNVEAPPVSVPAKVAARVKVPQKGQARIAPTVPGLALSMATQLFPSSVAWESWLESHHHSGLSGIWVKISKKGSGIASVTYDEAVDTALCYGWIDGQRKSYDEHHFIQKFTPRRKNSLWSKRNVEKVAVLIEAGRMRPAGQAEIDAAKTDGRWARAYASPSVIQVPEDFQKALDGNKKASAFFDALNKSQRYSFLWRIETTRRPETRKRKIGEFVDMLAAHKAY